MTGSVFMDTQGLYQRRRAFNMSYRNDLTCNLGEVIPVYWQDLIPNSTWHCRVHGLIRFMPLIAPILSNVDLYLHFWQAPYRILYGEDFTHVITGETEAEEWPGVFWTPKGVYDRLNNLVPSGDSKAKIIQYLMEDGSIFDLLGYDSSLMSQTTNEGVLNGRKFLMYIRLMHDWYANENVEPWTDFLSTYDWKTMLQEIEYTYEGDMSNYIGDFIYSCYTVWNTAGFFAHQWPKDYFTSALPTLQYGLPTYLPLGVEAPVTIPSQDINIEAYDANNGISTFSPSGGMTSGSHYLTGVMANSATSGYLQQIVSGSYKPLSFLAGTIKGTEGEDGELIGTADLSEATAITINELRITNALQVFKEREMRYGRKPQEYYRGFYGVTPGDLRLQMPKFLGGGRMPVNISDIEQTSQTTTGAEGSPQGNLSGKGTGIAGGFARASCFVPEETFVLGVAWLMPKVLYSQALSRHDTKLNDRFEYYNPSFAHIGEQPVYNYEVYAGQLGTATALNEFGYQPRYTEYRFHSSEIHGDLKNTLAYWTLGRIFDSAPALNANFLYMQPEALNRIFAVRETTDGFIARNVILSLQFQAAAIQPLSRYGTPGLMP